MKSYSYEKDPRKKKCFVDGMPWVLNHDASALEEMTRAVKGEGLDVKFGTAYLDDCITELPHLVGVYSHLPLAKIDSTLFARKFNTAMNLTKRVEYEDENPSTEFRGKHYKKRSTRGTIRWDIVQTKKPTEVIKNLSGELHVVLINAYRELDTANINQVHALSKKTGIKPTNTYILEGLGKSPSQEFVSYPANKSFILDVIEKLKKKSTKKDRLFFLVTNHVGRTKEGLCTFNTYNNKIREDEFYNMVKEIPCNFGLFYFAQCFSGGFAERIGQHSRFIGMSSTSNNLHAWGCENVGTWFSHYLIYPLISGEKTIEDAFLYAADKMHLVGKCSDQLPQLFFHNANPRKLRLNPKFWHKHIQRRLISGRKEDEK